MSERRLRGLTALVALAGVAIATYLTLVHYRGVEPLCLGGGGGCERVQTSPQSQLAGVPVALLGLLSYLVILASAAVSGELAAAAGALVGVVGFGFSVYLTYESIAVIDATCQWCLGSAGCMAALAALTCRRVLCAPWGAAPALNRRAGSS